MAEGARLESVYTRKCIEGSNPSLTAKFKEKAWIRVQAFFAWRTAERGEKPRQGSTKRLRFGPPTAAHRVSAANQALSHRQIQRESLDSRPGFFFAWRTAERGEKPRQGSTKRLRFGPPTAARRVSAANQPLSHRQIQRESLDSRPGFFFLHDAPQRGACAAHLPPSVTVIPISAGYQRTLPLMFSLFHGFRPAVRRSFQQSEHGLSGQTKTQKLFLTGSAPLPIVAPRCSDDFATKKYGEVSEWLKEHAWKVCIRESVSRVRIPPSPPYSNEKA